MKTIQNFNSLFSRQFVLKSFALLIFLAGINATLFAQSIGTIKGKVTDKVTGEPLPFTNVYVLQGKRQLKTAVADADAAFTITGLLPGRYNVRFNLVGYEFHMMTDVKVESGETVTLDARLSPREEALEEVEVVAEKEALLSVKSMRSGKGRAKKSYAPSSDAGGAGISTSSSYMWSSSSSEGSSSRGVPAGSFDMAADEISVADGDAGWGDAKHSKPDRKDKGSPDVETSGNRPFKPRLTAGEVNDFSKWNLWEDLTDNEFNSYSGSWKFFAKNRFLVQVNNKEGFAVGNAEVDLVSTSGNVVWSAKTDNTGKAELWHHFFENKESTENLSIRIKAGTSVQQVQNAVSFQQGINTVVVDRPCGAKKEVDISFVVDATGSMADEITFLQEELGYVIRQVKKNNKGLSMRTASVFYRDQGDAYLTRKSEFSKNLDVTTSFIAKQGAGGGGDFPEAVEAGLDVAINKMQWNKDAVARIVFLVLDAPPHKTDKNFDLLQKTIKNAAKQGIRIIPVASSGINKDTEFFLRSIALATNGTYTFLTDDSGIGNPHIKPSTDEFKVELLADLMIRLIDQYITIEDCDNDSDHASRTEDPKDEHPDVVVIPNPTSDELKVKGLEKWKEKSKIIAFIYDLAGKVLIRKEITIGKDGINISGLSNGTYMVKINADDDKPVTKKVLVRH